MERATRFEVAKQYHEAEGVYREALQDYPDNDEIRSALARLLSWQGHAEAAELYREVLTRIRRIKTFASRWRRCCRGRNSSRRRVGYTERCCRPSRPRSRLAVDWRRWRIGEVIARRP